MWQRPPSPAPAKDPLHSPTEPVMEFTRAQRTALLRIAHEAMEAAVERRRYTPVELSGALAEPRGVFTTLYRGGKLRGCVGYVSAVRPLGQAVAETARAAALEDTRFEPVERAELGEIEVSLSVLSSTFTIEPNDVEIGRHGLVISQNGRRGLLLPQVASEHGWDTKTFLEQTCFKADIPGDAWEHGATVEAFTAEVFGDTGPSSSNC
jgi:uncharacterized protein